MAGLFDGTRLQRPVSCPVCERPLAECRCPRDASGKVLLPGQQTARVGLGKRAGGKVVTIVEGLDATASNIEELLRRFKSRCAAGGTMHCAVIEVQGDHRQVVAEILRSEGYRVTMQG